MLDTEPKKRGLAGAWAGRAVRGADGGIGGVVRAVSAYPFAPNKANLCRFWPKKRVWRKSKANLVGRDRPPSQISDFKSQIAPSSGQLCKTKPILRVFGLEMGVGRENKANQSQFGRATRARVGLTPSPNPPDLRLPRADSTRSGRGGVWPCMGAGGYIKWAVSARSGLTAFRTRLFWAAGNTNGSHDE